MHAGRCERAEAVLRDANALRVSYWMRGSYVIGGDKVDLVGWPEDGRGKPRSLECVGPVYIRLALNLGDRVRFGLGTWEDVGAFRPKAGTNDLLVLTVESRGERFCVACADVRWGAR